MDIDVFVTCGHILSDNGFMLHSFLQRIKDWAVRNQTAEVPWSTIIDQALAAQITGVSMKIVPLRGLHQHAWLWVASCHSGTAPAAAMKLAPLQTCTIQLCTTADTLSFIDEHACAIGKCGMVSDKYLCC